MAIRTYRPSPTDFVHALHKVYSLICTFLIIQIYIEENDLIKTNNDLLYIV